MRTLYITIAFIIIMLCAIPFHSSMAVSPSSSVASHFVYMFGHAGFIHWAVNSWCLLMVHHLFKAYRLILAWIAAVLLSFVYYPSLPVLGLSVIISFFMGLSANWLYHRQRLAFWQMMFLLVAGCFLPQIAGLYHVILFCIGFLCSKVERLIHHARQINA